MSFPSTETVTSQVPADTRFNSPVAWSAMVQMALSSVVQVRPVPSSGLAVGVRAPVPLWGSGLSE